VAAHIGSDQPVLAVELLTARIRSGHSLKDTYDDMNFTPADLAKKNRARTLIVQGYARPILFFSAASSLIFLCASLYTSADWTAIPKVASISLLAVLGFGGVSDLLGIALTLGAVGDLLLGVSRLGVFGPDQLFLGGLAAFLLGHLVYIVMFAKLLPRNWARHDPLRELGVIAVLATLGLVLATIQHSLGPLLVPVIVYALVLATMATTALLADLGNQLAAIGALCFVASDAMLAMAKFRGPFALSAPLIWVTYYLAQLLISLGLARG